MKDRKPVKRKSAVKKANKRVPKKTMPEMPSRFSTWRENTVLCLFGLVGIGMVVRAGYLQIFEKEYLQKEGNNRYLRVKETAPLRGIIQDRNGRPMAVSTPADTIWVNPKVLLRKQEIHQYSDLARLSGKSNDEFYHYLVKNADTEALLVRLGAHKEELNDIRLQNIKGVQFKKRSVSVEGEKKSVRVWDVFVEPQTLINERDKYSLRRFAKLLELKPKDLAEKLKKNAKREFMYVRRHQGPELVKRVQALEIAGVNSLREYRRYYPVGPVASHVLGFTNIDNVGQEGIELVKNDALEGESGRSIIMQDRVGRIVEEVEREAPVRHGSPLTLSIDARIQYLAYRQLKVAVDKANAAGGSVVALDAKTGDVLAMVNMPAFNPNDRSDYSSVKFRNRSITDVFEPGSTVKPFSVGMALEAGEVDADTVIETGGSYVVGNKPIKDSHDYGDLTVTDVIKKSSNIGAAKIAALMPAKKLVNTYGKLGFGEKPGIELNGQRSGALDKKREMRPLDQAVMSYGYGLSVSALQLARAYTALAGDGRLAPVSVIAKNNLIDGQEVDKRKWRRVFSEETVEKLRPMLEKVVSKEGTAPQAMMEYYTAAGKTGTVHKAKKGGYHSDKYLSLFAGFAPANDPKVVMAVVVDDPQGDDYYGGRIAGPIFSKVMEGSLRFMNVEPDKLHKKPLKEPLAKLEAIQ